MIKKSFFSGLAVLLPIVITFWVFKILVNLLTDPFQSVTEGLLLRFEVLKSPFIFTDSEQALRYVSKFLILLSLIAGTFVVGLIGQTVLLRTFVRLGDFFMHRIPVVNKIYRATQEVVKTLLHEKGQAFSQVVLIPFPHAKARSIGLITQESAIQIKGKEDGEEMLSVFVPATPNPTMGFLLMKKKSELVFLDMPVEEALKVIVSCGIVFAGVKDKE
jgi:uncharacterized membrane protein